MEGRSGCVNHGNLNYQGYGRAAPPQALRARRARSPREGRHTAEATHRTHLGRASSREGIPPKRYNAPAEAERGAGRHFLGAILRVGSGPEDRDALRRREGPPSRRGDCLGTDTREDTLASQGRTSAHEVRAVALSQRLELRVPLGIPARGFDSSPPSLRAPGSLGGGRDHQTRRGARVPQRNARPPRVSKPSQAKRPFAASRASNTTSRDVAAERVRFDLKTPACSGKTCGKV